MFDAEVGAEQVELVLTGGGALAQAEEAVGELFPVVGQNGPGMDRAGPLRSRRKRRALARSWS